MSDQEEYEGEEEEEEDSSSYDITFVNVLDRRQAGGRLCYLVEYAAGEQEWVDRSDAWDFESNTRKIVQYDLKNPVAWDTVCNFCNTEFISRDEGCEECRCAECDRTCRHLLGVNYGCVKHPVI